MSDPGPTIYFLRHGVAARRSEWTGDDRLRPLTDAGSAALRRAAAVMARLAVAPDVFASSPLARARQTAAIAGEALGLADRVVEDARLAPGFDARRLLAIVADHPAAASFMVVGHEPDFSLTIGRLTGGNVACKKGSLARVDLDDRSGGRGRLVWLLQPKILDL